MRGATPSETPDTTARHAIRQSSLIQAAALPQRARAARSLDAAPVAATHALPALPAPRSDDASVARAARGAAFESARVSEQHDPEVWLIALPAGSTYQSLEGAGRAGAIRVGRPYGHLRAVRPVTLDPLYGSEWPDPLAVPPRATANKPGRSGSLGSAVAGRPTTLPAPLASPAVVGAVEVETDAGIFRVHRQGTLLTHSDMAWALAHLESGEPESMVTLPRRQLALLLTLLPSPEDPNHPEDDSHWGWAHRLRGPWERGPLHTRGRLGKLIAFDPDPSGRGMHRACFELLGADEAVWAIGVPCFHPGSVYELVPLGKGLHPSRWLNWPLAKGRKRVGDPERPRWEIARVVYRVGAPRWPLAGVVEPLGPLGVAG
jgi:hypothetical protein